MQTHGEPFGAAEVIESSGREIFIHVRVDWDKDGQFANPLSDLSKFVSDISVDGTLSGAIPSELMLIEGAAARELTMTVGGDYYDSDRELTLSFPAVFAPYNGWSPLYNKDIIGADITYDVLVRMYDGTFVNYRQFTGHVRTVSPVRGSNEVTITALDFAETLRQPVTLPPWAIAGWQASRGYEVAQLCDSQWVMDQALRSADIAAGPLIATPFAETNWTGGGAVRFWLTGNGSYIPNIGQLDNASVQGFPLDPSEAPGIGTPMYSPDGIPHPESPDPTKRPMNLAAVGGNASGLRPYQEPLDPRDDRNTAAFLQYRANQYPDSIYTNGTHWLGFRLITHGQRGDWWQTNATTVMTCYVGWNETVKLRVDNGTAYLDWTKAGGHTSTVSQPIPTGHESVLIEAKLYLQDGSLRMGLKVGDSFGTYITPVNTGRQIVADEQTGLIILRHHAGVQDVYWANWWVAETGGFNEANFRKWARRPAKRPAVLDRGLNRLTSMPQTNYDDAWTLLTEVASAEFGAVFFDENGVFRFWNRDTILEKQLVPVRTLTLDHASELAITNSLDSVRNVITSEGAAATAIEGRIFDSTDRDEFFVPAETTKTFVIPTADVQSVTPWIPRYRTVASGSQDLWNDSRNSGYVVEWYNGGSWDEEPSFAGDGVEIHVTVNDSGALVVRIWNGFDKRSRLATDAGDPAFRLKGTLIQRTDNVVTSVRDEDSIAKYGVRNLALQGDWVQRQPDALVGKLTEITVQRTSKPIPTTDAIQIAGDPRLQLGDTLEIQDPLGMGERIRVQILGITRSWSRDEGLRDSLTVEMIEPSGVGRWDSPQYGLWDSTFIWS